MKEFLYSSSAAGAKPVVREALQTSEVKVRHFNPESIEDLADLHDIDLDTRGSTVDVTGAPDEISPEDLREWMKDPTLYAVDKGGRAIGFVWFTSDTNREKGRKVNKLLLEAGWEGKPYVMEFNNGELKNVPEEAIKGWQLALKTYAESFNENEQKPVITAYTTNTVEGERFEKAGFESIGTVSRYYAGMDDGTVEITEKLHYVYALDLEHALQGKSAHIQSLLGARNRARNRRSPLK